MPRVARAFADIIMNIEARVKARPDIEPRRPRPGDQPKVPD
jgi:hypothetical protein